MCRSFRWQLLITERKSFQKRPNDIQHRRARIKLEADRQRPRRHEARGHALGARGADEQPQELLVRLCVHIHDCGL